MLFYSCLLDRGHFNTRLLFLFFYKEDGLIKFIKESAFDLTYKESNSLLPVCFEIVDGLGCLFAFGEMGNEKSICYRGH